MRRGLVLLLAALLAAPAAFIACSPVTKDEDPPLACPGEAFEGSPLSIRCGSLVDGQNREVLLTGMNARVEGVFDVALDGGRVPLEEIPPFTLDDARRMRALGFNALRLPLQWSGVEPTEDGGFDEAYLARVTSVVDLAHEAGLLVLLDLHQDAYSKEIGEDGAPYWAIVPEPPEKLSGPLTNLEARRLSAPVLAAFETFFGPSPDGARLRERFARMAAHVASRFASHDAVIGLELFNEPLATAEQLTRFHAQVFAAVRAAAPRKLVVFEPSATRNFLDRADIPAGPLGPGTAYAPHVYTAAFGADDVRAAVTRDALERSYVNAREEANAWQSALMVTEYGFPPADPKLGAYLSWHAELADATRASTFFWVWKETSQGSWGLFDRDASGTWVERPTVTRALSRVRLEAAAGRVVDIRRPDGATSLRVKLLGGTGTRENLVSLGAHLALVSAECDGHSANVVSGEPLRITCGGKDQHVLEVRARLR
jgi:endoglycosylceramidase